jgi:hypothetical protein
MKFTIREDIEAPLDGVFAALADFPAMEKAAEARGATLRRTGDATRPEPGLTWHATFPFRGRQREADITLTEYEPPERMVFDTVYQGIAARSVFDVVALSRTRTRVAVEIDLAPKTLAARLLVQSLKLARGSIEARLKSRASALAGKLETRLRRTG